MYCKEKHRSLIIARKEIGLEVNAQKTKYMVMSRDQKARNMGTYRQVINRLKLRNKFKYLGKTSTDQNSIHEEIKSKLKSGNARCHSVQNLLSSSLLSKNVKMKIHTTIILPVVLYSLKHSRSY
jgi:hypothetical protein